MHPLARPLLALAVLALARVCASACSHLILGDLPHLDLREVTIKYKLDGVRDKDRIVPVPIIQQTDRPLAWVKITACNLAKGGAAPYLLSDATKQDKFKAEVVCSYRDIPRCPKGVQIELQEHYHDLGAKKLGVVR